MADGLFAKVVDAVGIADLWVGWAERRFARRASREVLDQYWRERRAQPQLLGKDLYVRVVARHSGVDDATARNIVRQAEESFADWRFERDVTLRDVATYLVITAYLKSKPGRHGTTASIRDVVTRIVPNDL